MPRPQLSTATVAVGARLSVHAGGPLCPVAVIGDYRMVPQVLGTMGFLGPPLSPHQRFVPDAWGCGAPLDLRLAGGVIGEPPVFPRRADGVCAWATSPAHLAPARGVWSARTGAIGLKTLRACNLTRDVATGDPGTVSACWSSPASLWCSYPACLSIVITESSFASIVASRSQRSCSSPRRSGVGTAPVCCCCCWRWFGGVSTGRSSGGFG